MRFALLFLASVFFACSSSKAVIRTWDGGGGNSSWQNASNWNPDGVPQAADDVIIHIPHSSVVVLQSGSSTIHSLLCNQTLVISAGTKMTINGTSSIHR